MWLGVMTIVFIHIPIAYGTQISDISISRQTCKLAQQAQKNKASTKMILVLNMSFLHQPHFPTFSKQRLNYTQHPLLRPKTRQNKFFIKPWLLCFVTIRSILFCFVWVERLFLEEVKTFVDGAGQSLYSKQSATRMLSQTTP